MKIVNSWKHLYSTDWTHFEILIRFSVVTLFHFKIQWHGHPQFKLGMFNFRIEL